METIGKAKVRRAAAAAANVFGVIELLEQILSHLPIKDILLLKCTSKTWRAAIEGSQSLCRALCTEPTANISASTIKSTLAPPLRLNNFKPIFLSHSMLASAQEFNGIVNNEEFHFNPLIDMLFDPCFTEEARVHDFVYKRGEHPSVLYNQSCREMYLTQPPTHLIQFELDEKWGQKNQFFRYSGRNGAITLGELAQLVRSWREGTSQPRKIFVRNLFVPVDQKYPPLSHSP